MGDCRIRIQIQASLVVGQEEDVIVDRLWASDSTVQEVWDVVLTSTKTTKFRVWDCTLHPVTDITEAPIQQSTLYTVGWFPSARLQVLPVGWTPQRGVYDEDDLRMMNDGAASSTTTAPSFVARSATGDILTGHHKPSQILQSAAAGTAAVSASESTITQAISLQERRENQRKRQERERRLQERLSQQIAALESKAGSTSQQVRRMLIKSRATGRPNLAMMDRLHFQVLLPDNTLDYRYFSRQDTVGKVLETFASSCPSGQRSELLVSPQHRRLPVLWRLYEAVDQKYLVEFATLVVRFYDPATDVESPSVLLPPENDETEKIDSEAAQVDESTVPNSPVEVADTKPTVDGLLDLPKLAQAIAAANSKSKKPSKKPSSGAVDKVKQMQMKSKAKGDGKRVKLADRFYMELMVVVDGQVQRIDPIFLSQQDPLSRIRRDCVAVTTTGRFLVPSSSTQFRELEDESMTLQNASKEGLLSSFGRVIYSSGNIV